MTESQPAKDLLGDTRLGSIQLKNIQTALSQLVVFLKMFEHFSRDPQLLRFLPTLLLTPGKIGNIFVFSRLSSEFRIHRQGFNRARLNGR